jgi:FAD/FMN-containing dehydrogenase
VDNGIVVEGLTREFKGGIRAVDGIDLTVEPGEIYGFLGPNGAGKSTTVHVLTTLLPPTSGRARVAGFDVVRDGPKVRAAIGAALAAQGTPGIVMCHLSHVYRDGASLYFTFLARRRPGAEIDQWRAVKAAASEAIVGAGGTITHHHAVGRDHAPYMRAEVGELGIEVLKAVKERLDPAGIMNPGKLLP